LMTLPAAASNPGRIYRAKRINTAGAGACQVTPIAAVDGGPTVTLAAPPTTTSAMEFQSDGTNWWVISLH
jgi:hypothetical protein